MSEDWSVPAWAGLLGLGVVVLSVLGVVLLALAGRRARIRTEQQLRATRSEGEALRRQVETIEQRLSARRTTDEREHVITMLGEQGEHEAHPRTAAPAPTVAGPLFADLVLRESVVQGAALAAGVRRALAPEQRHRVRLEMKREVKRARKQRRADLRAARRDLAARQRAEPATDGRRTDSDRAA